MHTKLPNLSVFFVVYNEEQHIDPLTVYAFNVLSRVADCFEIIFVNDGSVDETDGKIRSWVKKYPGLVCHVSHPTRQGLGVALRSGFSAARFDPVFFTHRDLQFDLSAVNVLLSIGAVDLTPEPALSESRFLSFV